MRKSLISLLSAAFAASLGHTTNGFNPAHTPRHGRLRLKGKPNPAGTKLARQASEGRVTIRHA